MKMLSGLVLGLAVLLPAELPKQGRELTADEQKEVARLKSEASRHLTANRFEEALQVLKRVVDYRVKRQGVNHWQVIDARLSVERWQRLTSVPAKDRAEVVRALRARVEGQQLQQRLRYREAEAKLRQSLVLYRQVLGEQHPETAIGYNNLGFCLDRQGRYADALPLHQKALAIRQKALGEQHPETAASYGNIASCLDNQNQHAEALPFYRKALAINRKALGEEHPSTAQGYNNLAMCLNRQGDSAAALPLLRKALAIRRRTLGEQHSESAASYNNLAGCLRSQGLSAEALPLFQKALVIFQKALGEQHPTTALSYNNLAACLSGLGRHAEALALHRKALAIKLEVHGAQHADTAFSFNGVAVCLSEQGRYAEALPLFEKALDINRQMLGEHHPQTAASYNNLAGCLNEQGKYAQALPLFRKALAIYRQVHGERHPHTASGYNNVAYCLDQQGQHAEALPLYRKALAIRRKVLGEQHPDTATGYNNVAMCLHNLGELAEALPLYDKALALYQKTRGEQHPDTAQGYNNAAFCLFQLGKRAEAAHYWEKALPGSEWGRLHTAASGFDRSLSNVGNISPRSALAACLVRLGKPLVAWQHAEADLARGLLDDLLPAATSSADTDRGGRLRRLDQALLSLLAIEKPDAEQVKRRDALARERDALLAELADSAARRLRARVRTLPLIQKQLPAGAALVFWLDVRGEHLGCVLRGAGPPAWVSLPGLDKSNAWTNDDQSLPDRAWATLADGRGDAAARQRLLAQLHRQRLAPLEPHLKGVRQLFIVPTGRMSAVPIEALTDRYTISYVSSASVFARQAEQHRPLRAASLLVLADPVFRRTRPKMPAAPSHGLLILAVTPGSLASRIGLRPGDVLLEYNGKQLSAPADLRPAEGSDRVPVKLWRAGKTLAGRIPAGKLGVVVDNRPIAEALAAWRKQETELLTLGRGGDWQPLPGTRLEARALAALVPKTVTLLGSEASQQKLAELASADKLKDFRLLHLATHGQANAAQPKLTALILAQDHADDPVSGAQAVLAGKRPVDGRLTVGAILSDWKLNADLVVLSACQTGLGTDTRGSEGMLGFTQALLQKGARSVVLSRWKVDDAATALLMTRFYENLLGKRSGTKPLGRAAALGEAKAWLRDLSREEATKHLAALVGGVPRGERGSIKAALPTRSPDTPKGDDRPFAAPYYWAAFVLIGDPN